MLHALVMVLAIASQEPAPTPPDEELVQRATTEKPAERTSVWLPIVLGVGTGAAVLVTAMLIASASAIALNTGAAYLSTEAVLYSLLLGMPTPFVFALLAFPGAILAPAASIAVITLGGRWRVPSLPALLIAIGATLAGMVVGTVIHEAGIAVGLVMLWITYVFVVILDALIGACLAAVCGSSGSSRQPQPTDIKLSRDDSYALMAIMAAWTATLIVPTAIGATVGCIAGNLTGIALGRARSSTESLSVDALDVPAEDDNPSH